MLPRYDTIPAIFVISDTTTHQIKVGEYIEKDTTQPPNILSLYIKTIPIYKPYNDNMLYWIKGYVINDNFYNNPPILVDLNFKKIKTLIWTYKKL